MSEVTRVTHRRANHGMEREYQTLVTQMIAECARFPGYKSSAIIPPREPGEEFHIIQKFANREALENWTASSVAADWHARLDEVSEHPPEYRLFDKPDLWLSPEFTINHQQPPRWKMAVVTWMAIFPLATLAIWLLMPVLGALPFVLRMALITFIVVGVMYYLVMPRMLQAMKWWLHPKDANPSSSA